MLQRPPTFRINRRAPLANGLVFAGLGGGASTLLMVDASGYGNNGTLTGMDPPTDWVWVPELGRWALDFDGSDDYVLGPQRGYLSALTDFTVAHWLQLSSWPPSGDGTGALAYPLSVYNTTGNNRCWGIVVRGDNTTILNYSNLTLIWSTDGTAFSYGPLLAKALFADWAWHHVAFTRNGTTLSAYVDGVFQSSETASGTLYASTANLQLAQRSGGGYFWPMRIADPWVSLRSSGAPEIQQLADPSNALLSGLILPPRRKWWPVVSAPPSSIVPRIMHHRKLMGAA